MYRLVSLQHLNIPQIFYNLIRESRLHVILVQAASLFRAVRVCGTAL